MALAASICLLWLFAAQDLPSAIAALENGKLEDAAGTLSDILKRTPDDPEANYYLGITYFREGRTKQARPYLERATRLSPSNAAAWKALGLILLGADEHRAASVSLSNACALDPKDEDSCYLLGRSLFVLGKYNDAVAPFEKALRAVPPANQAAAHRAAALNFVELGMTEDAERHFRDAVRLYRAAAGVQPDPRVDYGAFLTRQGRARDALALLQQSIAAFPDSPRAQAELGRALLELDRPADALPALKKAVDLDPNAWAVRLMLGKAYLRLGRTEEGERELKSGQQGWSKTDYGSSKNK
jgi:Flp pilus assembly protein TadD